MFWLLPRSTLFPLFVVMSAGVTACGSSTLPATPTVGSAIPTPTSVDTYLDPTLLTQHVATVITHNLDNHPDLSTAIARRITAEAAVAEITSLGGQPSARLTSVGTQDVWLLEYDGEFVGVPPNVRSQPASGKFVDVVNLNGAEIFVQVIYGH